MQPFLLIGIENSTIHVFVYFYFGFLMLVDELFYAIPISVWDHILSVHFSSFADSVLFFLDHSIRANFKVSNNDAIMNVTLFVTACPTSFQNQASCFFFWLTLPILLPIATAMAANVWLVWCLFFSCFFYCYCFFNKATIHLRKLKPLCMKWIECENWRANKLNNEKYISRKIS